MKRSITTKIIGCFYICGAVVILFSIGVNQDVNINERVGLSFLPELYVRIFISIFWIVMSYGYLNLKKWGYWIMLIYSIYITVVSINLAFTYQNQNQIFIGNIMLSSIIIIYTFDERLSFG
ncbi:hypothetical protein [Acetobacterium woodii]|uniref:hypothetical protein n=1 Tax=Acetobacterium woodii TaxID=33952 RepID=UPI0005A04738|nr:hypothetical protein [Acetobacterium woodii]